jgi:hypothetical protein
MYLRGKGRSHQLGSGPAAPTLGATDFCGTTRPQTADSSSGVVVDTDLNLRRARILDRRNLASVLLASPPSAVRLLVRGSSPRSGCTFIVEQQNSADPRAAGLGWS